MWHIAGLEIIDRNRGLVVVEFFFTTLSTIVLLLRLFTRAKVVRTLGWDDWLMAGAMVMCIAFFITVMFQIKYGLGEPADPVKIFNFLKAIYSTIVCYNLTQTLYKLSMTLQSYRLFSTPRGRRIMMGVIIWVALCGCMTFFGALFYCDPVAKAWDDRIPGHCANRSALIYSYAGFNIFNDLLLLAIPAPFILTLQIAPHQRLVLISVFASGFLTSIISIIRLKALYDSISKPEDQQPVTGVNIALWSALEINVAIICGSVPALKVFVTKVVLRQKSSYAANSRSGGVLSGATPSRLGPKSHRSDTQSSDDKDVVLPIQITVHQDIEMKSYAAVDDQGSEKNLVTNHDFVSSVRTYAYSHPQDSKEV